MFRILKDAFDFIFPKTCHICGALLDDDEEYLCPLCLASIPRTDYHSKRNNRFEERFAGIIPFERGASLFFYEKSGPLADLIVEFKYKGYSGLARAMGRILGRELKPTGFLDGVDTIIPIGMPLVRLWHRGYNQAEELAKGIADILGRRDIPVLDCLKANRYHSSQTRRSAEDRAQSMRGFFSVRGTNNSDTKKTTSRNAGIDSTDNTLFKQITSIFKSILTLNYSPINLNGHTVLLVDDVCTTGSTMIAAADALTAAFPDIRLILLTLASTT